MLGFLGQCNRGLRDARSFGNLAQDLLPLKLEHSYAFDNNAMHRDSVPHLEPLPIHSATGFQLVRNAGIYLLICFLILTSMAVSQMMNARPLVTRWPLLMAAFVLPMGIYLVVTLLGFFSTRRKAIAYAPAADRPWTTAIQACVARDSITLSKAASARVWNSLLQQPSRPSVVADARLAQRFHPAPEALLEPESIEPSQRGMVIVACLFLMLAGMSAMDAGANRWWNITVFFALSAFFLAKHPKVRNAFPGLRNTGRDLIAGPGWVTAAKQNTRWTIEDSIMLVQCKAEPPKSGASPAIVVRFIGPPGIRDIQFASSADPDFQLLWQRWTTPLPRLDLDGR